MNSDILWRPLGSSPFCDFCPLFKGYHCRIIEARACAHLCLAEARATPEVAQLAATGVLARDQLPQEDAEGEDVGHLIALAARQQLRRGVRKGAHAVEVADVRRLDHLRQPHIRDLGLALSARQESKVSGFTCNVNMPQGVTASWC